MSVDNVQSKFLTMAEFGTLTEAEQARYNSASKAERKQMTIEFRQAKETPPEEPVKGTAVEKGEEEVTTPEEKQTRAERRAEARKQREAEIARQKEAAQKRFAPQRHSEIDEARIATVVGEDDDAFYRNKKAQKELRGNTADAIKASLKHSPAYTDEINKVRAEIEAAMKAGDQTKVQECQAKIQQMQEFFDTLADISAKADVRRLKYDDRVEHTAMFDTRKEMREARRADKEADADAAANTRYRVHKKKILSEENAHLHGRMRQGMSSHEAAYDIVKDIPGADSTFDPNEYKHAANLYSNKKGHMAATKAELRRMGFDVKDDTFKNIAKALPVAVLSQVGTAALPAVIEATAVAFVQNSITGEYLAYDEESASVKYVNWKGMGIGAAVGTAVAAAMFGDTQDEDVLHGSPIKSLFGNTVDAEGKTVRNYENMSFGSKDDSIKVKTILRAFDQLDMTDAEKIALLEEISGKNSQGILSKKELAVAFAKAYEQTLPEPVNAPEIQHIDIEIEDPEIHVEPTPVQVLPDENLEVESMPYNVLVNNNDTYAKIAERFGVDVDELIKLNVDAKGLESGHIDCEEIKHQYLVAGKEVKLPGNANPDTVRAYNDEFTADRIRSDYIKYVTGDAFLEKNRDCYKNIKAAGPEAEKAFKEKMINEAKAAGVPIPEEFGSDAELSRDLRDKIKDLKTVVENQKKHLKDTYGIEYDPGDKTLQQQTEEMNALIDQKAKEAKIANIEKELQNPLLDPKLRDSLETELEDLTGRQARAAEILKELEQPMLNPEIADALAKEYQELTGKPVPGFGNGDFSVNMPEVKTTKAAETPKPAVEPKTVDRAAEILEELQTSVISPEYADELRAEYQELTGKPVPGDEPGAWSTNFNPFG